MSTNGTRKWYPVTPPDSRSNTPTPRGEGRNWYPVQPVENGTQPQPPLTETLGVVAAYTASRSPSPLTQREPTPIELIDIDHESTTKILEGRLPSDQEQRLLALTFETQAAKDGYPDNRNPRNRNRYALGFNQSGAFSVQEAERIINDRKGLWLDRYGIPNRCRVGGINTPTDYMEDYARRGYYGDPANYRFIVAIPLGGASGCHDLEATAALIAEINGELPCDFTTEAWIDEEGLRRQEIPSRYVAGVINKHGIYLPNINFLRDGLFQLEEFQRA